MRISFKFEKFCNGQKVSCVYLNLTFNQMIRMKIFLFSPKRNFLYVIQQSGKKFRIELQSTHEVSIFMNLCRQQVISSSILASMIRVDTAGCITSELIERILSFQNNCTPCSNGPKRLSRNFGRYDNGERGLQIFLDK